MAEIDASIGLFPSRAPGAPLILLLGEAGEGEAVCRAAREMGGADFALAALSGMDWNRDLSPWPAPAVFRGGEAFSGGADAFLSRLTGALLPEALGRLPAPPAWVGLAGYSLAGLFALYALHRTDAFARAVSASGSMWYPGFSDYVQSHPLARRPERLYLSVGDREARTRNPAMRPVEENTRLLAKWYQSQGIETAFELNPGGHFDQPAERTAKGIAWLVAG